MLKKLSIRLTDYIIKTDPQKSEKRAIYEYGMLSMLEMGINILSVVIVALVFGQVWTSLFLMLGLVPLRQVAGGPHANTSLQCYFSSMGIYIGSLLVINFIPDDIMPIAGMALMAFSIVSVFIFAPESHKNKPITGQEFKKYKRQSRILILICALVFAGLLLISATKAFSFCTGAAVASLLLPISRINLRKEKLS